MGTNKLLSDVQMKSRASVLSLELEDFDVYFKDHVRAANGSDDSVPNEMKRCKVSCGDECEVSTIISIMGS